MLLGVSAKAEDFDFVAKVENIFVFTDDYENSAFINKAQVKFEGNPITLSGCNPNHIVFQLYQVIPIVVRCIARF